MGNLESDVVNIT
jgi:hypothetical protein